MCSGDVINDTDSGYVSRSQPNHSVTIRLIQTFLFIYIFELILLQIGLCTEFSEIKSSIILSGDPMQLDAVAKSKFAIKLGIKTSYIEQLFNLPRYQRNSMTGQYESSYIIQLTKNYRSHEAILQIPNELFYGGALEPKAPNDATDWFIGTDILPNSSLPIIIDSIKGNCCRATNDTSPYNIEEADLAVKYIKRLLEETWKGRKLYPVDIGVVSPYRKQCKIMMKKLREEGLNTITVGTAETFQGQEKPVIIISTVRTDGNLGFVRNERVSF